MNGEQNGRSITTTHSQLKQVSAICMFPLTGSVCSILRPSFKACIMVIFGCLGISSRHLTRAPTRTDHLLSVPVRYFPLATCWPTIPKATNHTDIPLKQLTRRPTSSIMARSCASPSQRQSTMGLSYGLLLRSDTVPRACAWEAKRVNAILELQQRMPMSVMVM